MPKKFGIVIHTPIFNADDSDLTPVLALLPPHELHLLIGPVNTMYNGLADIWPESGRWLKSCNVKKTEYHGGSYAGNDNRKLVRNVQSLEDMCPDSCNNYVDAFKCFDAVVSTCYGDKLIEELTEESLHHDFKQISEKFQIK